MRTIPFVIRGLLKNDEACFEKLKLSILSEVGERRTFLFVGEAKRFVFNSGFVLSEIICWHN